MKVPIRVEVSRPPEEVFAVLSDCRNEEIWNSKVSSAKLVGSEPVGEGTAFSTINRGKPYSATITVHDSPRHLAFDVKGQPDMTATYSLVPDGNGTIVEGELDMSANGLLGLLLPLMRPMIRKDLDRQYQSFKALCESR